MNASVREIRYVTYWIDFDEILYLGRAYCTSQITLITSNLHLPMQPQLNSITQNKTVRSIKMETLPKTSLKYATSISDILCRSFLSKAVSCSHCLRLCLLCDRLRSYRPSETDVRSRKASEHQKEPHRDPEHIIIIIQSAPAGTYRDVIAAVFRDISVSTAWCVPFTVAFTSVR